jgi:hypothetical protein
MKKPSFPYNKPSSNSAIRNHAPRCKQTMPRHMHYSPTKSYPNTQGHGHAFPLATVPQRPRTIPLLLEIWHTELGRLLHQASPRNTPQVCMPNNPHGSQQSRIQKTLQATVGPTARPTTRLPPLALLPENRRIQKIGRERKRTNNKTHRNTNKNVCR